MRHYVDHVLLSKAHVSKKNANKMIYEYIVQYIPLEFFFTVWVIYLSNVLPAVRMMRHLD